MSRSKISVKTVSEHTGVSPATVSRAINHPELVNRNTLSLVYDALKELGYDTSDITISKKPEKEVILVNCPEGSNPFYQEVFHGVLTSAESHGYHVIINYNHINNQTIYDFKNLLRRVNATGLITLSYLSEELLNALADIPLVQCCEYNTDSNFPLVGIDDYESAKKAVNFLISAGRNKIAFINGPMSFHYAKNRLRGYIDGMNEAQLFVPSSWVQSVPEINYDMSKTIARQMLSSDNRPNAIFAASDLLAAAVINAAKSCGLRIPADVMVMGFDNIFVSQILSPTITTLSQPIFQMGFTACELLIENMLNHGMSARRIFLPTELIIRESATNTD